MSPSRQPFQLHAVVHLVRPAGLQARDLLSLRAALADAPERSLFHHAVQYRLRDPSGEELPPDDLSAWVGGVVQDPETAERIAFAVLSHEGSPDLRARLLAVLDHLPEPTRRSRAAPEHGELVLLRSDSVRVPLGEPHDGVDSLMAELLVADPSVWFFHLHEEPWLSGERAPLLDWLQGMGHGFTRDRIEEILHARRPLEWERGHVRALWHRQQLGKRVSEATQQREDERSEATRKAAAGLVRRLRGKAG